MTSTMQNKLSPSRVVQAWSRPTAGQGVHAHTNKLQTNGGEGCPTVLLPYKNISKTTKKKERTNWPETRSLLGNRCHGAPSSKGIPGVGASGYTTTPN